MQDGLLPTVAGQPLQIMVDGETFRVGNAVVTTAEIAASNGVIHAMNSVIIPPVIE